MNHLAPTYLTVLLSPVLNKTGKESGAADPARVIWTSTSVLEVAQFPEASDPHPVQAASKRDIASPDQEGPYYGLSKFLALMSSYELLHLLQSSSSSNPYVVMAMANPGLVKTQLGQKDAKGDNFQAHDVEALLGVKARNTEEGARTLVQLGTYPVDTIWASGRNTVPWFDDMQERDVSPPQMADEALRKSVWLDTAGMIGLEV